MFKIHTYSRNPSTYYVESENHQVCLHSDGSALPTREFWPTREQAQAVLDKYRPAHVWKHGDVFRKNLTGTVMIYVYTADSGPMAYSLQPLNGQYPYGAAISTSEHLDDATFLFNIRDRLGDTDGEC